MKNYIFSLFLFSKIFLVLVVIFFFFLCLSFTSSFSFSISFLFSFQIFSFTSYSSSSVVIKLSLGLSCFISIGLEHIFQAHVRPRIGFKIPCVIQVGLGTEKSQSKPNPLPSLFSTHITYPLAIYSLFKIQVYITMQV